MLLSLGDQPHVGAEIIGQVVEAAKARPYQIVIPSHGMRRGHPIYLPKRFWSTLLRLGAHESLRVLLKEHNGDIFHVNIESNLILQDMDTQSEYERLRSQNLA